MSLISFQLSNALDRNQRDIYAKQDNPTWGAAFRNLPANFNGYTIARLNLAVIGCASVLPLALRIVQLAYTAIWAAGSLIGVALRRYELKDAKGWQEAKRVTGEVGQQAWNIAGGLTGAVITPYIPIKAEEWYNRAFAPAAVGVVDNRWAITKLFNLRAPVSPTKPAAT